MAAPAAAAQFPLPGIRMGDVDLQWAAEGSWGALVVPGGQQDRAPVPTEAEPVLVLLSS